MQVKPEADLISRKNNDALGQIRRQADYAKPKPPVNKFFQQ